LGADGVLAVDGSECFGHGLVGLGGFDHGADGCSDDQGEREGVAGAGVHLGGALWSIHFDDGVVGALSEAVDADLAQVAAEGLDQPGGQVGGERSSMRAVAQEAEGDLDGGLLPDSDRQASAAVGFLE
jgi:hypothetical protein